MDEVVSYNVYLKHPFTMLVAGPTGSGESTFIKRLIETNNSICSPPQKTITYCYGVWQSMYESIKNVKFVEGITEDIILERWVRSRMDNNR